LKSLFSAHPDDGVRRPRGGRRGAKKGKEVEELVKLPRILRQTWRGWRCEYTCRTPDGKVVVGFTTSGGLWEEVRVKSEKEAAKLRLQVESLGMEEE
jgi:hypothetical protein